jgi:hypothetical protein
VPTHENGSWRIKINQEIYNKFKSPDTIIVIKYVDWKGLDML